MGTLRISTILSISTPRAPKHTLFVIRSAETDNAKHKYLLFFFSIFFHSFRIYILKYIYLYFYTFFPFPTFRRTFAQRRERDLERLTGNEERNPGQRNVI